jgi:hypothetical protein
LRALADDVDTEASEARARVAALTEALEQRGLAVEGRVDEEGDPRRSLLDGLREFPAHEVLLVPDGEPGWEDAKALAERLRSEIGIHVRELGTA